MRVAVTGASGLIGSALAGNLRSDGHEVIRLVRRPPRGADEVRWDPRAADAGLGGASALSGIDACVHLAGAGVAAHRWTRKYKAEIRSSRVLATSALASALARLASPPAVLLVASAIGYYGNTGGHEVTEDAPPGSGFLSGVVRDWEAASAPASEAGIRVVRMRSGIVLARRGGILARLVPAARFGLCPRFGTGQQVMSWISVTDEIRAIRFLLDTAGLSGPVNLTAPSPVTNDEFTGALHKALGRPDLSWLRVPEPVLKLALGEMSSEVLNDARVLPRRLSEAGFVFRYPAVAGALAAVFGRKDDVTAG